MHKIWRIKKDDIFRIDFQRIRDESSIEMKNPKKTYFDQLFKSKENNKIQILENNQKTFLQQNIRAIMRLMLI